LSDERKKPGPDPEVFKVPLPFEQAVKAALETNPPPLPKKKRPRKKPKASG
jgi:hypothetical protein